MSLCEKTHPHTPHFYRAGTLDTDGPTSLVSCPGIDVEPLAPERDRDATPLPDYSPETLHLTEAAAFIIRLHRNMDNNTSPTARAQYITAMAVWSALTGQDEATALTYAYSIGTAHPPVTAVLPPF